MRPVNQYGYIRAVEGRETESRSRLGGEGGGGDGGPNQGSVVLRIGKRGGGGDPIKAMSFQGYGRGGGGVKGWPNQGSHSRIKAVSLLG